MRLASYFLVNSHADIIKQDCKLIILIFFFSALIGFIADSTLIGSQINDKESEHWRAKMSLQASDYN